MILFSFLMAIIGCDVISTCLTTVMTPLKNVSLYRGWCSFAYLSRYYTPQAFEIRAKQLVHLCLFFLPVFT